MNVPSISLLVVTPPVNITRESKLWIMKNLSLQNTQLYNTIGLFYFFFGAVPDTENLQHMIAFIQSPGGLLGTPVQLLVNAHI